VLETRAWCSISALRCRALGSRCRGAVKDIKYRDEIAFQDGASAVSPGQKTTNCAQPLPQDTRAIKTRATAEAWAKKRHPYRRLPTQFRRDGFNYRQIAREGNAAIYEQTWGGCAEPSVCYEVIRIRRRGGFQIGDRFVEPAEVYLSSGVWGADGFTLTDKDAAFGKLRKISLATTLPPATTKP
jgi:hypothetical protein